MDIERKRKEVELLQVTGALGNLELQVMERELDILRMRDAIKIQENRKRQLEEELKK